MAVGVRIVLAARRKERVLGPAVTAYLLAISLMFCAAMATGNTWAIVGAALFVASDSVLGWRQFVAERPLDAGDDHGHLPPRPSRPRRQPPVNRRSVGARRSIGGCYRWGRLT